jgi:hypothetical protein
MAAPKIVGYLTVGIFMPDDRLISCGFRARISTKENLATLLEKMWAKSVDALPQTDIAV